MSHGGRAEAACAQPQAKINPGECCKAATSPSQSGSGGAQPPAGAAHTCQQAHTRVHTRAVTHTGTRVPGSCSSSSLPVCPPLSFAREIGSKNAGALIAPGLIVRRGPVCHLRHCCPCHLPLPASTIPLLAPVTPQHWRELGGQHSSPEALQPQHLPRSRGTRRVGNAAASHREHLGGGGSRLPSSPALRRPPGGPFAIFLQRLVPNQALAPIQTPPNPGSHQEPGAGAFCAAGAGVLSFAEQPWLAPGAASEEEEEEVGVVPLRH